MSLVREIGGGFLGALMLCAGAAALAGVVYVFGWIGMAIAVFLS